MVYAPLVVIKDLFAICELQIFNNKKKINMATLKECKENEIKINIAILKVEKYLNCKNGHWNNVKKVYTFKFGEKYNEREIELSNYALFHIESLVND